MHRISMLNVHVWNKVPYVWTLNSRRNSSAKIEVRSGNSSLFESRILRKSSFWILGLLDLIEEGLLLLVDPGLLVDRMLLVDPGLLVNLMLLVDLVLFCINIKYPSKSYLLIRFQTHHTFLRSSLLFLRIRFIIRLITIIR